MLLARRLREILDSFKLMIDRSAPFLAALDDECSATQADFVPPAARRHPAIPRVSSHNCSVFLRQPSAYFLTSSGFRLCV
eukprot:m.58624 g.58624  ORF g.58624 m.58624 type:complete len:80 (-) comp49176_c0_seq1:391-630(-)